MTLPYLIVTFAVLFLALSPFYYWAFTHDGSKETESSSQKSSDDGNKARLEHENEALRQKIDELEFNQAFALDNRVDSSKL